MTTDETSPVADDQPRSTDGAGTADVSVVIATMNRPGFLRTCLEAIFAQDCDEHVEAIVVFDRSDPDEQLLADFAEHSLTITRNTRNPGLAGARNTGTLLSSATWVAFCDDDDVWFPDKLSRQLAVAEEFPDSDLIVGGLLIDHDGTLVPRPHARPYITHDDLIRSRVAEAHPSTFLFRRERFLRRVGLMDEELFGGHATDYDLLLRYAELDVVRTVPEPVVRIAMHTVSYFGSKWAMKVPALDRMLAKHDFTPDRVGEARIRGQRAFSLAASGQRADGLREAAAVVRLNPAEARGWLAMAVAANLVTPERVLAEAYKRGRGI